MCLTYFIFNLLIEDSYLEIAQAAQFRPITEISEAIGIKEDELDLYGKYKAKVSPNILKNE